MGIFGGGPKPPAAPPPAAPPARAGEAATATQKGSAARLAKKRAGRRKGIASTIFAGEDENLGRPTANFQPIRRTLG